MARRISLLVLAIFVAAFGYFMVWVSQIDEAEQSPLGPTYSVGIAAFIVASLLVVGVAASWLRQRFAKPSY